MLRLEIHRQMTSHNFKRNLGALDVSKFDCLLRHFNHTLQLLHHSRFGQQGNLLVQKKLALKRNTFCPTATGENNCTRTLLDRSGSKSNVSRSGTTSTGVACLFSMVAHRSLPCAKKCSPTDLAGAILLGPLRGFWCDTHAFIEGSRLGTESTAQRACGRTLLSPCDKEVVTGNGWRSSVTGSSVSSQVTTFTLAEQSLSSFQWPSCPHRARANFLFELVELGPCNLQVTWSTSARRFIMALVFPVPGLQLVIGFLICLEGVLPRPLDPGPPPLGQSTLLTVLDAREHPRKAPARGIAVGMASLSGSYSCRLMAALTIGHCFSADKLGFLKNKCALIKGFTCPATASKHINKMLNLVS